MFIVVHDLQIRDFFRGDVNPLGFNKRDADDVAGGVMLVLLNEPLNCHDRGGALGQRLDLEQIRVRNRAVFPLDQDLVQLFHCCLAP